MKKREIMKKRERERLRRKGEDIIEEEREKK